MHGSVVGQGDMDSYRLLVLNHHPIGADIDPTLVRITGDDHVSGPQVTAPIVLVPLGSGELKKIDILSFHDVFEHRTRLHLYRANGFEGARHFAPFLNKVKV